MMYAVKRDNKGRIESALSLNIPEKPILENYEDWEGNIQERIIGWEILENEIELPDGFELYTEEGFPVANAPSVPSSISMRQARLALLKRGILEDITEAINSLPENLSQQAQIEWDYGTEVSRENIFVNKILLDMDYSEDDIDELFIEAQKL